MLPRYEQTFGDPSSSSKFMTYWKNPTKTRRQPPFYRTIHRAINDLLCPYKTEGWVFSEFRKQLYINEYSDWEIFYLPVNVKGLTVLDIGAGEGETARFYFNHGAKKVICIEPDDESFKLLLLNAKNRAMQCYHKTFDLSDLLLNFDVLKMDIEGYEEALLTIPKLTKPCIIEVHGLQLVKRFLKKGYKLKSRNKTFSRFDYWFGYVTSC
jgi:SAM-dependent methyltransferase